MLRGTQTDSLWHTLIRVLLVWAISSALLSACSKPQTGRLPSALPPVESDREPQAQSDDPDSRRDWFLFQRTYPGTTIPADARRRAWELVLESRREAKPQSEFDTQAATGWRALGPAPTISFYGNLGACSGRINAIAVSPANSRVVLVGGATGGIWRSNDSGNSFTPVSDDQVDLAVGSIAFSRSSPSIVYAGMGDTKVGYLGSGVLKSTDEGRSWRKVSNSSLPSPATVGKIEIDPSNPNRLYAAQYSRLNLDRVTAGGVYVSNDGGVNWTRGLAGAARDVVIDPGDSRIIYAGLARIDTDVDPPFGLYRSTDRGANWTNVFEAPPYSTRQRSDIRIAISAANPRRILVCMGGVAAFGLDVRLALSTDGGDSWTHRGADGFDTAQFGYNTYLIADPQNENVVYLGTRDVYKSTDGGATWTNLTLSFSPFGSFYDYTPTIAKAHPDQHSFAFSTGNSSNFYIGNDGGIWRTGDGGASFQNLNATLSLAQFTGLALHPTDPNLSFGGTQDNGTQRRLSGSMNWFEFLPGDGGRTVITPLDPSIVFVTYIRGNIYRYFDHGLTLNGQIAFDSTFGELGAPRMAFYPPFEGNGRDSTLYFGTWRLFISNDFGNNWNAPAGETDLTKGLTERGPDVLTAIGVSSTDTNVIYTGSLMGRAMNSSDGGASWRDVTAGLPNRSITSATVDPASSATVYLTVSGFGTGHVFRTTDSGATWTGLSSGLPDVPANAFLIDPLDPNTLYAGTDVGVFRSLDRGTSWREFNRGIPPVVIHEFAAQSTGLIQVATYGRGIYEILGNERPSIESVVFDGKKKLTISGRGFGEAPRVLINGVDKTSKISSASATSVKLKGKASKLGLSPGENSVQVFSDNVPSGVFLLRL